VEFLTKNLALKIAAFFLALLFWFNVVTNKSYEYEFEVDFGLKDLPEDLILTTPPPDKVKVRVEGTGKQMLAFLFKNPSLLYDAGGFEGGFYRIELTPTDLTFSNNVRAHVLAVENPQDLTLKVETVISGRVPVEPQISVEPALGYTKTGELRVSPDSVDVKGPSRFIRRLRSIPTEDINFRDVKKDVDETVKLVTEDTMFLTLETTEVDVHQNIVPLVERKFGPIAIETYNSNLYDSVVFEPESLFVIIEGAEQYIDTLDESAFSASINFRSIEAGSTTVLPKVMVPPGYQLVGTQPQSISVTTTSKP
jgi:YbbR domain-containing protein